MNEHQKRIALVLFNRWLDKFPLRDHPKWPGFYPGAWPKHEPIPKLRELRKLFAQFIRFIGI